MRHCLFLFFLSLSLSLTAQSNWGAVDVQQLQDNLFQQFQMEAFYAETQVQIDTASQRAIDHFQREYQRFVRNSQGGCMSLEQQRRGERILRAKMDTLEFFEAFVVDSLAMMQRVFGPLMLEEIRLEVQAFAQDRDLAAVIDSNLCLYAESLSDFTIALAEAVQNSTSIPSQVQAYKLTYQNRLEQAIATISWKNKFFH